MGGEEDCRFAGPRCRVCRLLVGGSTSELSADETGRRLLAVVNKPGRFVRLCRLCRVAVSEPPRGRAMMGAIGCSVS